MEVLVDASQRDLPVTRLQSADASPLRSRWVGMIVGTYLGVMGCGGGGSTDVAPSKPVDTSTLVGSRTGSVNGDGAPGNYGYSTTLSELRADSTLTITAASQLYGTVTGTWTVGSGKWGSTVRDRDNVVITFSALVSPITLTGTWTASSGKTGTFTMAKLP